MLKFASGIVLCSGLAACGGGSGTFAPEPQNPTVPRVMIRPAYPDASFVAPLAVSTAPGDDTHLYVAQQDGRVLSLDTVSDGAQPQPFLDLRTRTRANGEQGLLGLAFDPDYASNGFLYVYYSANANPDIGAGDSVIARFTADPAARSADPGSEVTLLRFAQPFNNHNGGGLAMGPDGHLYIGSGDGGSGNDPQDNAQNPGKLLGKILRIATDGSIPTGNPFIGMPGARPEIWALGLRNPFRISFDSANGRLWAGDVGQGAQEEIDLIQRGGNYGWRLFEGTRANLNPDNVPFTQFAPPVFSYPRSQGRSITGGVVYRGSALPSLTGRYVYGDFVSGRVWMLTEAGGAAVANVEIGSVPNPSSFGFDLEGEILITAFDGQLYRVVGDPATAADTLPARLSQTGLFTDVASLTPAADLFAYRPAAEFWSDGSDKQRWLQLPEGGRIGFDATGPWSFPVGTRTIKHFDIALADGTRKRLETRVFELRQDGWLGYTYRWNAAGSDAGLLAGGATEVLTAADDQVGTRTQTYHYPDRAQCLQCHTAAAGFVLGLRTAQLNFTGPWGSNALQGLREAGAFETTIDDPRTYPQGVDPFDPVAPLAARARAYLDTNCAHCHRPGGPTPLDMDLRAAIPMAQTATLDVPPTGAGFGVAEARRIAPGQRARSLVWTRMLEPDAPARMPPLSSHVLDTRGADLIGSWIDAGAP